jgi:hypothetical protein
MVRVALKPWVAPKGPLIDPALTNLNRTRQNSREIRDIEFKNIEAGSIGSPEWAFQRSLLHLVERSLRTAQWESEEPGSVAYGSSILSPAPYP